MFPDVSHILCIWHIEFDVELNVLKLLSEKALHLGEAFRKGPWKKLVYSKLILNTMVSMKTIQDYKYTWRERGSGRS